MLFFCWVSAFYELSARTLAEALSCTQLEVGMHDGRTMHHGTMASLDDDVMCCDKMSCEVM